MKYRISVAWPVMVEIELNHEVGSEEDLTDEEYDRIMDEADNILQNNTIKPVITDISKDD